MVTTGNIKTVHPDAKGRITLGALANGVSSFHLTTEEKSGRIILEPFVEIPAREKWLFDNKSALKQVKRGLEDSASGRVSERGDFSQYTENDDE